MPRAPGPESLGGIPSPRSGKAIATYDTSAVGRGIADFGAGIQEFGARASAAYERLQDGWNQVAALNVETAVQRFQFEENQRFLEAQRTMQPGQASGFTKAYLEGYENRAGEFARTHLQTLPAEDHARYDQRLFGIHQDIFGKSVSFEFGEEFRAANATLETSLNNTILPRAMAAGNEAAFTRVRDDAFTSIDANPALTPIQADTLKQDWLMRMQAARAGWLATNQPDQFLGEIGLGATGELAFLSVIGKGETGRTGMSAYNTVFQHQEGNLPKPLTTMTVDEVLAYQQGKGTHPVGQYQIVRTTLQGLKKELGLTGGEVFSPGLQDRMAQALLNRRGYQEFVRGEITADEFFGRLKDEWDILNKSPKVAATTLAALKGEAVPLGEYADNSLYSALAPEDIFKFESEARKQQDYGHAIYQDKVNDYVAYLEAGNGPTDDFSPQQVVANLGQDDGTIALEAIADAQRRGEMKNAVAFATPEELLGRAAELNERLSSPDDFRDAERDAAIFQDAVNDREKALADDPASYVLSDGKVADAFAAIQETDNQEAVDNYVALTRAAQERLGMHSRDVMLLPDAVAGEYAARFFEQGEGAQKVSQTIQSLADQWGDHWPSVYQQIGKDLPAAAVVVGSMNRPEQRRAAEALSEIAAEVAGRGLSAIEKQLPSDNLTNVKEQVASRVQAFNRTLVEQPGGVSLAATFHDGIYLLALRYALSGASPGDAASRAYQDVVERAYTIQDTYRVPVDYSAPLVASGASVFKGGLPANVDVPESLIGLDPEDARAAYQDSVSANGRWITNSDESGLWLMDYGGAQAGLVTINGEPLTVTWDELIQRGRAASAGAPSGSISPRREQPPTVEEGIAEAREEAERLGGDPDAVERALRELTEPETAERVPGMVESGNITDLETRARVRNEDGSYSSIRSASFSIDGREVLLPTLVDGQQLTEDEAVDRYLRTGEHLGIFDSPEAATAYSKTLSAGQTPARQGLSQAYIDKYLSGYRQRLIDNGTSEADADTMTARKRVELEARGQ